MNEGVFASLVESSFRVGLVQALVETSIEHFHSTYCHLTHSPVVTKEAEHNFRVAGLFPVANLLSVSPLPILNTNTS